MTRYLLAATLVTMTACATPQPQALNDESGDEPPAQQEPGGDSIEAYAAPEVSAESSTEMQPEAVVVSDDVVCNYETPTGSRIKVRVCRSRAVVDEHSKAVQQRIEEMRRQTPITSNPPGMTGSSNP